MKTIAPYPGTRHESNSPSHGGGHVGLNGPAQARPLDTIRGFGAIGLCAHPNSLPFASKAGNPPGFQVELGQALARELGVSLKLDWIITQYQMRSAGCDIVLDVIADREAQGETRLAISKPYYRTGVALAVPSASKLTSFKSLDGNTKVGVQVASIAAMVISQRHVPTSTFGFEVDSLEALPIMRSTPRRSRPPSPPIST